MKNTIKCVILDDELLAISYLKLLCESVEYVEVIKVFNNPRAFLEEINNIDCNLCILDIEMPGINGLQVAEQIAKKHIIFTTAYKEYAAEAFDLNVIDYVRKPIKKERLLQAFDKVWEQLEHTPNSFLEWNSNLGKSHIEINQILYIQTSEIDSRDKDVLLLDHIKITLKNINFKKLLDLLPEKEFAQINKKEIVAIRAIKAFSNNEIHLKSKPESNLSLHISDVYRNSFLEKINS
ncbi:response regulator transcription factor [Chryseobacterium suipulveris]|uniref:Response regulator transcription factor n=1 Tax=Chryseobacterium suipulveris TaxID=2929800 RepID=A0ABY4BVN2_9FLAO|nr:response regulator transcription factor [Chryseobacterium suipulveris]UOE42227.1 response regulator transcription factor [Chryseobacterium suipulveris]